jgi:hypothetical protein
MYQYLSGYLSWGSGNCYGIHQQIRQDRYIGIFLGYYGLDIFGMDGHWQIWPPVFLWGELWVTLPLFTAGKLGIPIP